jgi:hypothetical protein
MDSDQMGYPLAIGDGAKKSEKWSKSAILSQGPFSHIKFKT